MEKQALALALADHAENDPATIKVLEEASVVAQQSCNRWMDNLWALESWLKKNFGSGREQELAKFFKDQGFTDALDYL